MVQAVLGGGLLGDRDRVLVLGRGGVEHLQRTRELLLQLGVDLVRAGGRGFLSTAKESSAPLYSGRTLMPPLCHLVVDDLAAADVELARHLHALGLQGLGVDLGEERFSGKFAEPTTITCRRPWRRCCRVQRVVVAVAAPHAVKGERRDQSRPRRCGSWRFMVCFLLGALRSSGLGLTQEIIGTWSPPAQPRRDDDALQRGEAELDDERQQRPRGRSRRSTQA